MRREDTALVCGIYGLDIFWHLFCFPTPTLGKAGWSSQSLLQPGSWPLLSLLSSACKCWHQCLGQGGRPGWGADVGYTQPSQIFLAQLQFFSYEAKLPLAAELWAELGCCQLWVTMLHLLPRLPTKLQAVTVPPLCHPGVWGVMYSRCSSQDRSAAQTVTSGRGTITNPQPASGHRCLQSQCLLLAKKYMIFFFLLLLVF